jgi:hypothetical protein
VFTDELEVKLERATVDMLGSTGSVTITKDDTIVLNGEGASLFFVCFNIHSSQSCIQARKTPSQPVANKSARC